MISFVLMERCWKSQRTGYSIQIFRTDARYVERHISMTKSLQPVVPLEHYWLCGTVRDLSLVYAIEGKKEYAKKAIEILTKYTDAYPNGTIMDQTLEEAVNLIPLAEAYDLLFDIMTPEQRSHIKLDLLWPGAQALTKAGMGGNWGSWHLSAIGVIGYATRHQRFY